MKIYLFLREKILTFVVPQKVSGSFSFDENPDEEAKLINVEARDKAWYIYQTDDVKIVSSEDCYVQINYTSPGGYAYNVTVCPGDSNKDILERIPKMFGI